MNSQSSALDAGLFAERLLTVVDEGRRTATYKLALLSALIDCCIDHSDENGNAPSSLSTRTIVARVIELYWEQLRDYEHAGQLSALRQIAGPRSAVLGALSSLKDDAEERRVRRLDEVRTRLAVEYERAFDDVLVTFVREPIPRLQVVGGIHRPFIYECAWNSKLTRRQALAERSIEFLPGAADALVRFAPLLRPLIELHWTRMVASLNGLALEDERLRTHLFGCARTTFPRVLTVGLGDLQARRCFYCGSSLVAAELDHFLPWSRWPTDAIQNLVASCAACNNSKRDHLAAPAHLRSWVARLDTNQAQLAEIAKGARWPSDLRRCRAVARSLYSHLSKGTPLWASRGAFIDADHDTITAALGDS